MLASADTWTIQVKGRGGHASMPHHAVDPIPVAFEIGLALHAMVTRRIDVFDPVVLTCGKVTAGTANNVIPETVEMIGHVAGDFQDRARKCAGRDQAGRLEYRRGAFVPGRDHDPARLSGHRQR